MQKPVEHVCIFTYPKVNRVTRERYIYNCYLVCKKERVFVDSDEGKLLSFGNRLVFIYSLFFNIYLKTS